MKKFEENKANRTGETRMMKCGMLASVHVYHACNNIEVIFEDGYITKGKEYKVFLRGGMENPWCKTVSGVGYVGDGKYKTRNSIDRKQTKSGQAWYDMLKRCYNKRHQSLNTSYRGCSVCEEWHNYQNFAKWYEENTWSEEINFQLDKDILIKGNKIYSPDTCILVDNRINTIFTKNNKRRGLYPIGVSKPKGNTEYYIASMTKGVLREDNIHEKLGIFDNPLDAFICYKNAKEEYIKQVANKYKKEYKTFPNKLYKALYEYEVEITD